LIRPLSFEEFDFPYAPRSSLSLTSSPLALDTPRARYVTSRLVCSCFLDPPNYPLDLLENSPWHRRPPSSPVNSYDLLKSGNTNRKAGSNPRRELIPRTLDIFHKVRWSLTFWCDCPPPRQARQFTLVSQNILPRCSV